MRVRELITLLHQCDPEAPVSVWDQGRDEESFEVSVSVNPGTCVVHLGVFPFGDVLAPPPRVSDWRRPAVPAPLRSNEKPENNP